MIETLLWYVVLLDSLFANYLAWCAQGWYKKHYKKLYRQFPSTKGWCLWYLVLVLWIGYNLQQRGLL